MSTQPSERWSVSKAQISTTMDGETVVLNTESGRYFSLNRVGNTPWEALRGAQTTAALVATVVERYDVDLETATRDVRELLATLEEAGLVTRH